MIKRGDCLKLMVDIPDQSVGLILADPPYGTTGCKWDSVIPLDQMWRQINRILVPDGVVALMATQPFTTTLIHSNQKMFKYCWVWEKNFCTNHLHAKRQPLRKHEEIVIFYRKTGRYYPIKTTGHIPTQSAKGVSNGVLWHGTNTRNDPGGNTTRYPVSVQRHKAVDPKLRVHPTQKPVELMEYLIRTYTQEEETILDFAMGSGTTGVACKNTGRRFIGFEIDKKYFDMARNRLRTS